MYHDKDNIIFWPNVTICQYSSAVTAFLQSQKIKFVKKKINVPSERKNLKICESSKIGAP
jgi:hypothetical protein